MAAEPQRETCRLSLRRIVSLSKLLRPHSSTRRQTEIRTWSIFMQNTFQPARSKSNYIAVTSCAANASSNRACGEIDLGHVQVPDCLTYTPRRSRRSVVPRRLGLLFQH